LTSLDIAKTTSVIGITGYAVSGIASSLFHKWAKKNSFLISHTGKKIIIINNPITNWFSNISYFFILSVFSFMVAFNKSGDYIYLQLFAVYFVCFILAGINFYQKKNFIVVIDTETNSINVKDTVYPFNDLSDFEISGKVFWITDDITSHGLYIKDQTGKRRLVYGYSVFSDIEKLKYEIGARLAVF
jgi:hypothetical protein